VTLLGSPDDKLDPQQVRDFVRHVLSPLDLDGRSLCLVIPDATRRCPLPLLIDAIGSAVFGRVSSCTAVVALGTHAPMDPAALRALIGTDAMPVINHEWWKPETFVQVGQLDRSTVSRLSEGRLDETVDVRINRLVVDSDVTLIVGPVLPHEVVGFSGGNKYLFPGLSGQEMIDTTHWVGALLTSAAIIGTTKTTPVRALIDAAADLVPGQRHALCVVGQQDGDGLHALSFGAPISAWSEAVQVASRTHIRYLDRPVRRVLSLVPPRYADLWTGAKGFYKVEPIVADGGEVVLYAPHITDVAKMHPGLLQVGYHCRDFFLAHWAEFRNLPRGELAHATHLYGAGTYDISSGETERVQVTLATGIPEDVVRSVNLHYRDPSTIDVTEWSKDADALVVPDAGEVLYRLR
jgi:nickel-dependent lactate racemase